MSYIPTYDEAIMLLKKYNKKPSSIEHGKTVGAVMKFFSKEYDSENAAFWEIVGILHDLDFEMYPKEHCIKQRKIMREEGISEDIINACISHGYDGIKITVKPETYMEKIIMTIDDLIGIVDDIIDADSTDISHITPEYLKVKFEDETFSKSNDREFIKKGAKMLDWTIDELILKTLTALKETKN